MLRVALTGGIGSGKTTAAKLFAILGIPIYYSDNRAKELMRTSKPLIEAIKVAFGAEAYNEQGNINRSYLSKKVFTNKGELLKLNKLVHPAVFEDQQQWFSEQTSAYAIVESALIYEVSRERDYDKVIVVHAEDDTRIQRVMARDNADKMSVSGRIHNQLPQEEKMQKADFLIDNNGNQSLIEQVMEIHEILLRPIGNA